MVAILRSVIAYPVIALSTLVFGGVAIVGSWLPRRWLVADRAASTWARTFLIVAGLRFEVEGRHNLRPDRPLVVVSNHLSNLDPMVCWLALQPIHYRFMAKKEVFRIPIFRSVIQAMHMVKVDREAGAGGYDFINQQIHEVFGLGLSLLIYGEGTRSRTHDVKEFKKGPFIIADGVGAPILPVTIEGTDRAWPPGDWRMYGGRARVVIHPLMEQQGTPLEMRARVEAVIRDAYEGLVADG